MRKGYVIVLLDVADRALYVEYAKRATEIEARYGGRPLVVGDANEVVEGSWPAARTVILEFPSIDQARAWYSDPDYQAIIPMRHEAAVSHMLFIEGFAETE
jgi:uncharacterized protein (DUF1330 family)